MASTISRTRTRAPSGSPTDTPWSDGLIRASARRLACFYKAAACIDEAGGVVPIVVPDPVTQAVVGAGLVSSLWRQVEIHIGGVYHFISTPVRGIGVKY